MKLVESYKYKCVTWYADIWVTNCLEIAELGFN